MKDEYDFSTMKSRKNPYASKLKKSVTMRLGEDVISYFKSSIFADRFGKIIYNWSIKTEIYLNSRIASILACVF